MSEPKRIQVVRPNENLHDFTYVRSPTTGSPILLDSVREIDHYALGMKRLSTIQSMPLAENWPIVAGNVASAFMSGLLGNEPNESIINLSLQMHFDDDVRTGCIREERDNGEN